MPPIEQQKSDQGDFSAGLSAGVQSAISIFNGFTAAVSDKLGKTKVRDEFISKMVSAQEKAAEASKGRITSSADVKNFSDLADFYQFGMGQLAPFALESVASFLAGGAAGAVAKASIKKAVKEFAKGTASQAAKEQVTKAIGKAGVQKLATTAPKLLNSLPKIGANTAQVANSFQQGIGEIFAETGSSTQAFKRAPAFVLLDLIGEASILKGLKSAKAPKDSFSKSILGSALRVSGAAAAEGATEVGQQRIIQGAKAAVDSDFQINSPEARQELIDAGLLGAFGGGTGRVGTGLARRAINQVSKIDPTINSKPQPQRGDSVDLLNPQTPTRAIDPSQKRIQEARQLRDELLQQIRDVRQSLSEDQEVSPEISSPVVEGQPAPPSGDVPSGVQTAGPSGSAIAPQPAQTATTPVVDEAPQQNITPPGTPSPRKRAKSKKPIATSPESAVEKVKVSFRKKGESVSAKFNSNTDKALFLASSPKDIPAKRKAIKLLKDKGLTDNTINTLIPAIRNKVKQLTLDQDGDVVTVTDLGIEKNVISKLPTNDQVKDASRKIIASTKEGDSFSKKAVPEKISDITPQNVNLLKTVATRARIVARNNFNRFKTEMRKFLKGSFDRVKKIMRELFDTTGDVVSEVLTKPPFAFRAVQGDGKKAPGSKTPASDRRQFQKRVTINPISNPEKIVKPVAGQKKVTGTQEPGSFVSKPPAAPIPKPQPSVENPKRPQNFTKKEWDNFTQDEKIAFGKQGKLIDDTPVSFTERLKDLYAKSKNFASRSLIQGIFDKYHPLMLLDIAANKAKSFGEVKNGPLISKSSYMMARNSGTAQNAVMSLFMYDKLSLAKDGAITVNTDKDGLTRAIQKYAPDSKLQIFLSWMAARRARTLKAEDRENWYTNKDIETIEKNVRDSDDLQNFKKLEKIWTEYNNSVLDIATKYGLVDADAAAEWKSKGPYLPFYRLIEDQMGNESLKGPVDVGSLVNADGIKTLKGRELQIGDLFENAIKNWHHLITASLSNKAATQAVENAKTLGMAKKVPGNQQFNGDNNTIFIWRNGKKEFWQIDPGEAEGISGQMVLDALTGLTQGDRNKAVTNVFRAFKRLHVLGVTASPEFKIANLIRDSLQVIATSTFSGYNPVSNVLKGWELTKSGNPDSIFAAKLYAAGGTIDFGYLLGGDPETVSQLTGRKISKDTILDNPRAWDRFTSAMARARQTAFYNRYQQFGNRLENINRIALGKRVFDETNNMFLAAFESRDSMDFGLTGSWQFVRHLAQTISFFNARLQGLYKLGRSMNEDRRRFSAVTGAYALGALALYIIFRDRKEYQRLPEWEKMTYHHFWVGDQHFRLPRPFEIGILGSMVESSFELAFGDQVGVKDIADRVWFSLDETLNFGILPQMIGPGIEVMSNKDFFRDRPIEGKSLQRLLVTERTKPWTSFLAVGLSKATAPLLPKKPFLGVRELSPIQIEHLAYGYMGWMGAMTMTISDMIFRNMTTLPTRPASEIRDFPAIGRFVRGSSPARNTQQLNDFWEMMNEVEQVYATINELRKQNQFEKAADLAKKNRDKLGMRNALNNMKKQLQEINRKQKIITNSKQLTPKRKRLMINNLNEVKIKIADNIERFQD